MADTQDATFTRQHVFHDGTSMVVAKKGETHPVPTRLIQRFVDEGAIDEPKGWGADAEEPGEAVSRADGSQTDGTGSVDKTSDAGGEPGADAASTGHGDGGTFDHDGDGKPGGSEPRDPPSLSGKTKAELIAIAEDEGVGVADGATNAQIVEAIEAKRSAGDGDAPPA